MNQEQVKEIKIDQLIKVKSDERSQGYFLARVRSINDWTKIIGVTDGEGVYSEHPYRKIILNRQ